MHRVYCSVIPEAGGSVTLEARENEHLFKVFRARPGEEVEILDGNGKVASAVVEAGKTLRIISCKLFPEPVEKLHLCCALPRKQKLDQLLKQAAELGAWSIRPVKCLRSVAEGGPRERWDLLIREGCKQSGNPFFPRVEEEAKLPDLLDRLEKEGVEIYYGSIKPALPEDASAGEKAVLIGPEGGFAPEELMMMEDKKVKPLNLGPYTLRLETAAVCALSALRMLGVFIVLSAMVLLAGCSQEGGANNPLMVKGRNLRQSGDASGAKNYFLRAMALAPQDPAPYLALAQVCDEDLDQPLEAIFAYQMYLKLIPAGAAGRPVVEEILAGLKERAVKQLAGDVVPAGEYAALQQDLQKSQEDLARMKKKLLEQQLEIIRFRRQLRLMGGKK